MKKLIILCLLLSLPSAAFAARNCGDALTGTRFAPYTANELCNPHPETVTTTNAVVTSGGATVTAGGMTITTGDVTLTDGVVIQSEVMSVPAFIGTQGATAATGWVLTGVDKGLATLANGAAEDTLVIPINGLNVGDTVSAFKVTGQMESAGGAVKLDAELRKLTTGSTGTADETLGSITQVSKTADYKISDSKTLATPEVIATGESLYVLITGDTQGASTDIEVAGVEVTVLKGN